MTAYVLDTGALIGIERGRPRVVALIRHAVGVGDALIIPAACVAQAWRRPSRQALLASFLKQHGRDPAPLTGEDARACGLLLEASGTTDVVDAHVVVLAIRHDATVLTSDPNGLSALGTGIRIQPI